MLSLLFAICMIWFIGKIFIFGVKASWGILKLLCTVVFFPVILIGMVPQLPFPKLVSYFRKTFEKFPAGDPLQVFHDRSYG